MSVLWYILEKEFKQIFRDKSILAMMFALPLIQLIIVPLAMDYDVKNLKIVVVDMDHSSLSRQLVNKIGSSGYFTLVAAESSYRDGLALVENDDASLVLEIPPNFERDLVRDGHRQLGVSVDAINETKSSLGTSYLNTVLADFTRELRWNIISPENRMIINPVIEITSTQWFNPRGMYTYYVVPAILVFMLTILAGFVSALNSVREKEMGTMEQINVTPIRKWEFILGKMIPFWIIGMIVFTIGLLVQWTFYGIFPLGSIGVLYLFASVYLVALLGFGLLISTYSDNQLQSMFIAFFFIMLFLLMSGLFTPFESMPAWARMLANLLPITHFIKVIRMIILKGSGLADIKMELLYEMIFAIVLNSWAIWNYRKTS